MKLIACQRDELLTQFVTTSVITDMAHLDHGSTHKAPAHQGSSTLH